jgi:hypothetical protein
MAVGAFGHEHTFTDSRGCSLSKLPLNTAYTVNREIFAALKVGEFTFFSINGRQNSAFAAEI